jgi:hypothetical protein
MSRTRREFIKSATSCRCDDWNGTGRLQGVIRQPFLGVRRDLPSYSITLPSVFSEITSECRPFVSYQR